MCWARNLYRAQALASTIWCVRYQIGATFDGVRTPCLLARICTIPTKPDNVATVLPRGHIAELHQINDLILHDVFFVAWARTLPRAPEFAGVVGPRIYVARNIE